MSSNAIATPAAREPGPLVTRCRRRTVAKVDNDRVSSSEVDPVLGGVVVRTPAARRCARRPSRPPWATGAVVGLEGFDRRQGVGSAVLGAVDLREHGLCAWMCRLRQGGNNVGADVEPAPLLSSVGEHLPQRLPEPQRAITGAVIPRRRQVRSKTAPDCDDSRNPLARPIPCAVGAHADHHPQTHPVPPRGPRVGSRPPPQCALFHLSWRLNRLSSASRCLPVAPLVAGPTAVGSSADQVKMTSAVSPQLGVDLQARVGVEHLLLRRSCSRGGPVADGFRGQY
jgi:hypothetical protein